MAFGYQNANIPPDDDHGLTSFWKIGRKQVELEVQIDAASAQKLVEWGAPLGKKHRFMMV